MLYYERRACVLRTLFFSLRRGTRFIAPHLLSCFLTESYTPGAWNWLSPAFIIHARVRKSRGDFMSGKKLERDFQASLIRELKERFPGCMVMKLDSSYMQGVPIYS